MAFFGILGGVVLAAILTHSSATMTNSWAVQIESERSSEVADALAKKHGFTNLGRVS